MGDEQTILAVLKKHLPNEAIEKLAEIAAEIAMETGLAETVEIREIDPRTYKPAD
jgi:hypothetical protein